MLGTGMWISMRKIKNGVLLMQNKADGVDYSKYIEHSLLRPDASEKDIYKLCEEAKKYGFAAVAITPANVRYAAKFLEGTDIIVDAAIGFPLGTVTTFVKVAETIDAIRNGAREVDMVINIAALKEGKDDFVLEEMKAVVEAAHPDVPVKAILETFLLNDEEKRRACELAVQAGIDYVKTCTGFNGGCATVEDILLMRDTVKGKCKIKASTGINDRKTAADLINAGAQRLGTSKGILIVEGK